VTISAFKRALASDHLSGGVIRLAAIYEDRLGFMLAFYFAKPRAVKELSDLVIDKLSLAQKLELLKAIDLGAGTRSRDNLIKSLASLKKIRNHLAHTYYHIEEGELKKLYSDMFIRNLVLNFPKSLSDEKRDLESRVSKLWKIMLSQAQD
jgi:hypothetical protein